MLFSTATPSGTAPQGSTWYRVNAAGDILAQWQQTGAGLASTWTQRQVTSSAISNLEVGKLSAGSATILEVVQVLTGDDAEADEDGEEPRSAA